MSLTGDTRITLVTGVALGGFPTVLLLVCDLFLRLPWQLVLALAAGMFVFGFLLAVMPLGDDQRGADRRENSRVILLAWACLNGGRCETDPAAFTADGEGWELPASPRFRGSLLAVGHRDGVEVGISCSTHRDPETGTDMPMTVLVRLSEERSPARVQYRKIYRLGLGEHAESVAMGGRELWVKFEGWPSDFVELNAQVDAVVRVAASLPET
ncbi:hypothetical protein [Streptomyces sp. NPDC047061]|uniref:hypothetical protein n=1 Tax=Streptomyces sp. NPDC047061 TaxID=3154605 RepID=UPI0033DDB5C6